MNVNVFYVLELKTIKKIFLSVSQSFEGVSSSKQNLVGVFYV